MILIIGSDAESRETTADIFRYMGILTECVTPADALRKAGSRHQAVIVVGRSVLPDPEDFISRLRTYVGEIPIVALGDDISEDNYRVYDFVFSNLVNSSTVVNTMRRIATERDTTLPGTYRLAGFDASCELPDVQFHGKNIGLTKTEAMIVRYLILNYPRGAKPREILKHAFKSKKLPEESSIRTHISGINKKFNLLRGHYLICSEKDGYKILTPEIAERRRLESV